MPTGFTANADKKPSPYMMDPRCTTSTFGNDRWGRQGSWISIAGEWIRLETDEISRLMKKVRQAKQLRLQWEKEAGMPAFDPESEEE